MSQPQSTTKKSKKDKKPLSKRDRNVTSNGTTARDLREDSRMTSSVEEVNVARAADAGMMIKRLESSSAMVLPSSHRLSQRPWIVPRPMTIRRTNRIARLPTTLRGHLPRESSKNAKNVNRIMSSVESRTSRLRFRVRASKSTLIANLTRL